MNHDDLGNYSHTEVRALREQISTLQTQLATEKERADYAWRNTNTIEKARQEEMAKRDELAAALTRAERKLSAYVGVCPGDKELTETILPMARAALAKVKL